MIRINKEKLGGAIQDLETAEPANIEEAGAESCSCTDGSCGTDKGCKSKKWQEDT